MEINFDISRFKGMKDKRNIRSARSEIISNMVDRINVERVGTEWKPVTPRGIAVMVGHIKDLYTLGAFYKDCEKSGNFGKAFYGRLKVRK